MPEATPNRSPGPSGGERGSRYPSPSRGPLDPRLLRRARATRWYLAGGLAVGLLTAVLTIAQARVLADAIAGVFAAAPGWEYLTRVPGTGAWPDLAASALLLGAILAGRAALAWGNTVLAHRTAAAVKSQLRRELVAARLADPLASGTPASGLAHLATVGLDALDGYYARYLPQVLLAATVPVVVGAAVLAADWPSAVILGLTLPLIPVFMVLVGWTTEARARRRWATQQRLAHHFADLVAGLPTLQVFGRAARQAVGLEKTEAAHRGETMGTLRISFLSALVLELLATLSVAVVAVTVGFRVVAGELDLAVALFVLVLAPEVFLPVRQVGVHYHDSADGLAAAEQAFAVIDAAAGAPGDRVAPAAPGVPVPVSAGGAGPAGSPVVEVSHLTHSYPGEAVAAVTDVAFTVGRGEFVVLTGPSAGGKTTVLNAVLGLLRPSAGQVVAPPLDKVAFVGQQPGLVRGTIADNVRLGNPTAPDAAVGAALHRAGGGDLDPARPVGDDGEGLSAGERRRVATARALLRLDAGAELLLLDEPTAGLDADAEATLLAGLRGSGVAALVVSHRPRVLAAADRVVTIGATP